MEAGELYDGEVSEQQETQDTGEQTDEQASGQVETDQDQSEAAASTPEAETVETEVNELEVLKNEVNGLKATITSLRSKNRQTAEAPKREDVEFDWDNPDKSLNALGNSVEQVIEQKVSQKLLLREEAQLRKQYDDFDQVIDVWEQLAEKDPTLWKEFSSAISPVEFAYSKAKNHVELQEIGDVGDYKSKLKAELRQELEQEMNSKFEARLKQHSEIPGSLTEANGASGNKSPQWGGPPSAENLYD